MEYLVKLDEFEGPMDLLLHLIKSSEVEIFDISISHITKQYLDYLKSMEKLELNIAAEYLVMACELVNIKTAMLLPKPKLEESEYEEDPRQQLINRLIEYKTYKNAKEEFDMLKEERENYYTKLASHTEYDEAVFIDEEVDVYDLLRSLQKMNKRKMMAKPMVTVIEKSEISVEDRMVTLHQYLKDKKTVYFHDLFESFDKSYVITTFLAVLELVKESKITIDIQSQDVFVVNYKK